MENIKIISDNGIEINVSGLFYVFNSKYYFIYTTGEKVDEEYVRLYVVQVCKEVKNTPSGPVDTGYMLGMEISNPDEWAKVQDSITKIVEDKKNGTQNPEIQYLPMTMLVNLKVISNNKFKLMKTIVQDNFKVQLVEDNNNTVNTVPVEQVIEPIQPVVEQVIQPIDPIIEQAEPINNSSESVGEVIIDYRARFFEEQQKNEALNEEIKILKEKLENIKNIIVES